MISLSQALHYTVKALACRKSRTSDSNGSDEVLQIRGDIRNEQRIKIILNMYTYFNISLKHIHLLSIYIKSSATLLQNSQAVMCVPSTTHFPHKEYNKKTCNVVNYHRHTDCCVYVAFEDARHQRKEK